ncbi:MAG: 2-ketoisovalerate ferredoxin oxidoreductase [Campylobacteraceae bacterium]|jgi:pyruvate ferredoxin oxidoreductase alpha subunit|nr:2-ketoisovalerate ferredoxin oxidoreductase [Campylobacteraceae bacterium]
MLQEKEFLSGNEAVAAGVKLCRPHVIAAYPITPQTVVVERLSEMVESGLLKCEYLHVESEYSAMSALIGASAVGARTFTATSSQGLLYMAECLHYASGGRFPIVMMNANRSIALPWNIYGDQRDSLSLLDCGWIQAYAEDAQESLDLVIQAFKIAEDKRVSTPFMINLDGFVLTHTYESVLVPRQEDVDAFLPKFSTTNKMDLENPTNMGFSSTPNNNMEFKYIQHKAMLNTKEVIKEVGLEFEKAFKRDYGDLTDTYKTKDADIILITLGSITSTVRVVVDELRNEGWKVGLCKIRYMRPFPDEEISSLNAKVIGVLEKDISFGYEGTVFTNVNSALIRARKNPQTINFIAGLGGRSITKYDIHGIFNTLKKAKNGEKIEQVQFVNLKVST